MLVISYLNLLMLVIIYLNLLILSLKSCAKNDIGEKIFGPMNTLYIDIRIILRPSHLGCGQGYARVVVGTHVLKY